MDVFSRSTSRAEDEEALKWAAIQKLPTVNRLKKSLWISTEDGGGASEVDVRKLGPQERRALMEKLLRVPEEDNEKFLLRLKSRFDRVGIEFPTIEVRFEHLNVEAEALVGSMALPTFLNFGTNLLEELLNSLHLLSSRKKHLNILKDVSGIIKPSRMTLLLGPPSSGKTSLLLALAGKLDSKLKVSGNVTYNGHRMDEFVPQRSAAYISQQDLHMGELTVRETLAFAARCQGVGTRYDMLSELLRREKDANIKPDLDIDTFLKATATEGQEINAYTDYILKILGLEVCADTVVGDQMIRGISGGQRKRVTTGEMLVGPVNALFMDEISTGLDSSTTFQIVNSLKQFVHILNVTCIISLLQPAPETYNLFDDVILLSEGQIVYQGPREFVLEFFESMGFRCPERKGVADFLQEVTSMKDQQQYWASKEYPYRFVTVKEFSEAFQSFHVGRKRRDDLANPFDKRKSHPAALTTKKYGVNNKELLKACFSREVLLMKRNSFVYITRLAQLVINGLVGSTIFLRTEMHRDSVIDGGIYMGALFFTIINIFFNGMAEFPMTIEKLPVFFKQRDHFIYPGWAYSLPIAILKIFIAFVEVGVWIVITYFLIGLDPDVGRFFKQLFLLLVIHQMASAFFRFIAVLGRNVVVANTFGTFAICILVTLGGVVLSRDKIQVWWQWGYWISPMMYGQHAIAVNEFLGDSWRKVLPNSTETLGVSVLRSKGFFPYSYWYWIGLGGLLGYSVLCNIGATLAFSFLNPFRKHQAVLPEDSQNDADKTGGSVQLSLHGHKRKTGNSSSWSSSIREPEAKHNKKTGMVLPFEPHSITFDEITYSVDMPQEMKHQGVLEDKLVLLNGVSGSFRPGVLTALMGVSGAGKTTLMDVLAGRKTGGYVEGNITISGYPKKQETFARISGYCEQTDIHTPHLTVYESLLYSAWLRLPPEVDDETRMMFIEEVMELVELNPLRKALVGMPGVDGLSIEQRKRLTIAIELVANPSIIFMDEPTSGLDARAAAIVMRTVRNTVDTGRTVVCTIHQPSIDIFEAFDELFLLKQGGQEIYVGPLGRHSCHLIRYFEDIQGVNRITAGYNPATWMLEVTGSAQEIALGVDFTELYRSSELYRRNKALIQDLSTPLPGSKELHFPTVYSQSFFVQCLACLWKQHWSYWRNPSYTAVRMIFTTIIGLMFGSIFWHLGSKVETRQDLFNAMGVMYTSVGFIGIQNAGTVQPVVAIERMVFYRERAAGMYSALPYAIAQVAIEIPYIFVQAVVFGVIVYSMIQFQWTAVKFLWFFFFLFTLLLYYTFYGMMAIALSPNQQVGSIMSSAVYGMWSLFSGFLIPRTRIPIWWRWYYWANPLAYSLYGFISSLFGDLKNRLDTGETVEEFIESYFGFRHDFIGVVAAVTIGFTVLFAFLFAFGIKVLNFQQR
ncbi:pleiotropic drug resistance protein 1-like isoform X3 [Tripterygium wilfordii]|uniref:pleiotropic drug resistance protein 1-like isoform X3 n=1 Tax=Tripterygium wilfordii TaxID=458696 RepID=UPI0018F7F354|nr:pleiotropic drug resistance protein 1-like isoform X3 [Tripterygium wilfordii]